MTRGAAALVQRALVAYVGSSVRAGQRGRKLVADTRAEATRGFGRLKKGSAHYGRKPSLLQK